MPYAGWLLWYKSAILSGEDFVPQETSGNTWKHFQIAPTQREETENGYCWTLHPGRDADENYLIQGSYRAEAQ